MAIQIRKVKKLLIISPYFPPTNAADMQRIRMSLPYFANFNWQVEIVTVDPLFSDIATDPLLLGSIPKEIPLHFVKAWNKKLTLKLGLGSIAIRSLWSYRIVVNRLLKTRKFDLIYFSTTQFPVCILGAYWKRKFMVPYVVDMQDPWHSDYYKKKTKEQQPSKYWFSYRLNKFLEPLAIGHADGLISVSERYITDLKTRYPNIQSIPAATIPFGAFAPDMTIAEQNSSAFQPILTDGAINLVYVGRGGMDMHCSVAPLFAAFNRGLLHHPGLFKQIKLYFIGTSYAPAGQGIATIRPLAERYGIAGQVTEITDRIGYYHALSILQKATGLFIPGSDDPGYSASKLYPYLLTGKPALAIFHSHSPAMDVFRDFGLRYVFANDRFEEAEEGAFQFLSGLAKGALDQERYRPDAIRKYSAEQTTRAQCDLFSSVLVMSHKKIPHAY